VFQEESKLCQSDFSVAGKMSFIFAVVGLLKQLGPPSYMTTSGSGAEILKLKTCECGLDLSVISCALLFQIYSNKLFRLGRA
jgi:hypothetical protein